MSDAKLIAYKPFSPEPPYKKLWSGSLTNTGPSALTRSLLLNPQYFTGQVQGSLTSFLETEGPPADATNQSFVYTIDSVSDTADGSVANVTVWYVSKSAA